MKKPESFWEKKLTPEKYKILRKKATEKPFSGELLKNKEEGTYVCGACGNEIFSSETKFNSGTGWPSFYDAKKGRTKLKKDFSLVIPRTEVICAKCESHLGHVFPDGPKEKTGKRYCINSKALDFKKKGKKMEDIIHKTKIINLIKEKATKTKNRKDKEKLKELEEAVKNNKKEKINKIIKELPEDIAKGVIEFLVNVPW